MPLHQKYFLDIIYEYNIVHEIHKNLIKVTL